MGPPACDVPTLVWVASSRWRIESAFEVAKQDVGLDEYEVRNARSWDRHMILTLWALALLSVVRAASLPPQPQKGCEAGQLGSVSTGPRPGRGLTMPEIRWLWRHLLRPVVMDMQQVLAWSHWRRRQQVTTL